MGIGFAEASVFVLFRMPLEIVHSPEFLPTHIRSNCVLPPIANQSARNFDDDYPVSWDSTLNRIFNSSNLLYGVKNQMMPLDAIWEFPMRPQPEDPIKTFSAHKSGRWGCRKDGSS
jgi:hypothetical protein